MGAAPVGESLILEFLKKAPAAEFREVERETSQTESKTIVGI